MLLKIIKKYLTENDIWKNLSNTLTNKIASEITSVIHTELDINIANVLRALNNTSDLSIRKFYIGLDNPIEACVCYINGFVNEQRLGENIKHLTSFDLNNYQDQNFPEGFDLIDFLESSIIDIPTISKANNLNEVVSRILLAEVAVFLDGYDKALLLGINEYEGRSIEKPDTEVTIRGSQEAFTENLGTNMSLIRKRIRSPKLVFEEFTIGKITNTRVQVAYIKGLADKKIVKYVKRKLSKLDIDAVLESGYIEQELEENKYALFATIGNTEKPDKAAAKLLEGRIAVLCDGTPIVLTVPYLFIEAFQTTEDYYSRPLLTVMVRFIRYLSFFISIAIPGLYIAFASYHQEMIPTILLVTMMSSSEAIPFPVLFETLIMMLIFEILRESGIRLPRKVGQAVSIVGALIIGDAAVAAGILSSPMVIIGALTGLTSFIVPSLLDGVIFIRLVLIILSSIFGLYGFALGMLVFLAHLCSLKSFGANYFAPFAPAIIPEQIDTLTREPRPSKVEKSQSITTAIDQKRKKGEN